MRAEQDLLFGVMAVQLGFASAGQVLGAASAWAADRSRGLAERLEQDGVVSTDRARLLRGLVAQALEASGDDPAKAMASLGASQVFESFGGLVSIAPDGSLILAPVDTIDAASEEGLAVTGEHPGRYRLGGERTLGAENGETRQEAEIGRGGIGRVLLAFDEHLGREVAIKELLTEAGELGGVSGPSGQKTSAARARFLREARVTGQLEHPNIVPVYELGQRRGGGLYYAMRMVRGRTLTDALRDCAGLADRLLLLNHFVDLCQALAYAHSRGVIHRDVKPDNVMLGEFGETVVLDWGLAKVRGKRDIRGGEIEREIQLLKDAAAGKTIEGSALGTPAYMSPEQADGSVDLIDERSDVWSLGAVLYQLLTGRPPFEGLTAFEVMGKVLGEPLLPVRQLCPEAPAELATVCEKALCRNPVGRYSGARDLALDVERYLTGGRVQAYDYRSWELLSRFARRHRAALSVLVLALVVIASLGIWSYVRVVAERNRAREAEQVERQRRAEAQREGARAAFLRGDVFEARAKLRGSLETRDSAAARNLWRELRRQNVVWTRQVGDYINGLDYSPDGRLIALGTDSGNIQILDARTRALVRILRGHTFYANGVRFDPHSRLLASAGGDRTVRLWDVQTGVCLRVLAGHTDTAWYPTFNSDGSLLASSGADGTVRLWDVASGAALRVFKGGRNMSGIAFSPDGRVLYGAGDEGVVHRWDLASGAELSKIQIPSKSIHFLDISPDGQRLVAASHAGVHLIDLQTDKQNLLVGHSESVSSVRFNARGTQVVSAGFDGQVLVWDPDRGEILHRLAGHSGRVYSAAFSGDGSQVASSGWDLTARLWSLGPRGQPRILRGHGDMIWAVAFSPDGKRLVSGGDDQRALVWDVASGSQVAAVDHGQDVFEVGLDPAGMRLFTSGKGSLRAWDMASGAALFNLGGSLKLISEMVIHPDGKRILTVGDGRLRVWDLQTSALVETRQVQDVTHLALDRAGRKVALSTRKGDMLIHDLGGGADRLIKGEQEPIYRVAFSPDGRFVASLAGEQVRLWDVAAGSQRVLWHEDQNLPYRLVFTRDGEQVIFSLTTGEVLVMPVTGGAPARMRGHTDMASGVALDPTGRLVASTSEDGSVRLWDLESRRPIWRTAATLDHPAQVYTHRGWELLESGGRLASGEARWRRVIEEQGRWAEQAGDAQVCIWTWADEIQIWDRTRDERLQKWTTAGVEQMLAVDDGCLCLRAGGRVDFMSASGVVHSLTDAQATAMAFDNGQILVAAGGDILAFSRQGQKADRLAQVDPGVSAMMRQGGQLVLGYRDGNLELIDLRSGKRREGLSFEDLSRRPVLVLRPGPMDTLLVGYADGLLGMWDPQSGQRLDHARLHGPVIQLLVEDQQVFAISGLGDHLRWDLRAFASDYCQVLRDVWAQVPVIWSAGRPALRAPPAAHVCLADANQP